MPESINCAIIEDELVHQIALKKLVSEFEDLKLTGIYTNSEQAKTAIDKTEINLAFVDIILPNGNGMELATDLRNKGIEVIMTTSLDNFAIRAYDINAVDYLLKPIEYERFRQAVSKAVERINHNTSGQESAVDTLEGINPNTISYVRKDGDYLNVIYSGGKATLKMTLKSFLDIVNNDRFLRIHKSFLVNFDEVKKVQRDKVYLEEAILPLSRTGKANLVKKMNIWS